LRRGSPIAFTDPLFLAAWLPCVIGAFLLARRFRPSLAAPLLALASFLFGALAGWLSLAFLAVSVAGNFAAAGAIRRMPEASAARHLLLSVAIIANLAPLAGFKLAEQGYWPFGGQVLPGAAHWAIPLGLAFYTLQQIGFLVEVQRPDAPRLGFIRYAAWASFFGQLPAGPIGAYKRMAGQYARLGRERVAPALLARGLTLVLAGIVKKTWLADPLARKVDAVFLGASVSGVTPLEAWTAAWGFLLQLYFDFSAYSDIAIGVGLCFGLALPINFNSPLKAASPGQYVMRWHMSLMMFVRDHVFEPLFRIARRLPIRPTARRYAIAWAVATLGAFLAVAAWHTLAPFVLLEGLGVAALIVVLQFARQRAGRVRAPPSPAMRRIRTAAGHLLLLLGASLTALFLRPGDQGELQNILPALFDLRSLATLVGDLVAHPDAVQLYPDARLPGLWTIFMLAAASVIVLACPNTMEMFGIAGARPLDGPLRWRPTALWGWLTILLLLLAMMGMTRPVQPYAFIYARF
jgi:D-alanyl-lipoteichoic acid acyltransferase DltB (MBOAT superfamily)